MDKYMEILSLRAAGHVKRWHTVNIIGQQNDAEHSAQALSLLCLLHPNPSPALMMGVLWHDAAERDCGDVPAPILRRLPLFAEQYKIAEGTFFAEHPHVDMVLHSLTADDKSWLKAVDRLELLMFCFDQLLLGNSSFEIVKERAKEYILNAPDTPDEVIHFINHANFYTSFI